MRRRVQSLIVMSSSHIAVLLLTAAAAATSAKYNTPRHESCGRAGWWFHEGHCYLIDPRASPDLNWHDAIAFCPTASEVFPDAYLAEIMSEDEQEFLHDMIYYLFEDWESDYWLGGHDLVTEGEWEWDHSKEPLGFTAWAPGRPNGTTAENCLVLSYMYSADYKTWDDRDCADAEWMKPLCKVQYEPEEN